MRALRKVIAAQERELRRHRLFGQLQTAYSAEQIGKLARALSWWPMVFQDVLRLTFKNARGSGFEQFAEYDWDENIGHDCWYIEDLRALGVEPPSLEEQFFLEFQPVRDACYQLMAEVHRPQSAAERIAFLVTLEPTGRLFFEHISQAVERVCPEASLLYFKRSHLEHENEHDLFVEATRAELDRVLLSQEERTQGEQMVARVFQSFNEVFSYLSERMEEDTHARSDVRELGAARRLSMRPERLVGG